MNAQPQPLALLVLGMHRSGTSAMGGLLSLAGIYSGPDLMPGVVGVNPKGYFEHSAIYACHERLLSALGSIWHDDRSLPAGWWKGPLMREFRLELTGIVRRDFAGHPLWMLKDPRLCRLLPLWKEMLGELEIQPRYLEVLRHPLEVARSIEARDGIRQERACLLWLVNLLECLGQVRDAKPCFVTYDDLLADWRAVLHRIVDELRLPLPPLSPSQETEIDAFLEPQLRHHRASDAATGTAGEIAGYASEIYASLKRDRRIVTGTALFDELDRKVRVFTDRVADWSAEMADLRARLGHQQTVVEEHVEELDRMRKTWSWQLTKLLRLPFDLKHKRGKQPDPPKQAGRGGEI